MAACQLYYRQVTQLPIVQLAPVPDAVVTHSAYTLLKPSEVPAQQRS